MCFFVLFCFIRPLARAPTRPGPGRPGPPANVFLRLGYSNFACVFWKRCPDGTIQDHWIFLYGRVTEKSSAYAVQCVFDALALTHLYTPDITRLRSFTDGPKQFKSAEFLGSSYRHFVERPNPDWVRSTYGGPCHWKGMP